MLQLISAKKFKVFWCILLQKVLEPADTEEHRLWLSGRAAGFKGGPTDRPTDRLFFAPLSLIADSFSFILGRRRSFPNDSEALMIGCLPPFLPYFANLATETAGQKLNLALPHCTD